MSAIDELQSRLNSHVEEVKRLIGLAEDSHSGKIPHHEAGGTHTPAQTIPHPARASVARSHPISSTSNKQHRHEILLDRLPCSVRALSVRNEGFADDPTAVADCHPWTDAHNQDQLNETTIKNGYSEKSRVPQEFNQARATIWPHLKQGPGLQALSSIFTATLQQRKELGRVSSQSTFKPPPRVTLTDSKREAWLRDLADDSVPLRKLSRTIPHGIRGKILLDQCQSKAIPFARAVWLVKCVGANELRAFRRKGVSTATAAGNESKWVKEWTSLVEAFIEGSIMPKSDESARARIDYAIRLAVQLYSEKLLDPIHFLDWILGFLQTCELGRLPVAILILQNFWQDMVSAFSTAQRATAICCLRLAQIADTRDGNLLNQLKARLRDVIMSLFSLHSRCCVFPSSWTPIKSLIMSLVEGSNDKEKSTLTGIVNRNEQLAHLLNGTRRSQSNDIVSAVQILDAFDASQSTQSVTMRCLAVVPEPEELLNVLVNWATSACRPGRWRPQLAAACIQQLNPRIGDASDVLIRCVAALPTPANALCEHLSLLFDDLISKNIFNPNAYLRWCLTSGVMNSVGKAELETSPCAILVRDMPLQSLSSNAINLRRVLLNSVYDAEDESGSQTDLQRLCLEVCPTCLGSLSIEAVRGFPALGLAAFFDRLSFISGTNRKALSHWLTQRLMAWASKWPPIMDAPGSECALPCGEFQALRRFFEQGSDTHSLAILLRVCIGLCDLDLLSQAVDTIYANRTQLSIDASYNALVAMVIERYRRLRRSAPPLRDCVFSLWRLAIKEPRLKQLQRHLDQEREICNQTLSAVAYTPASESMAESQELADSIDAEVDHLLSNATSIDMTSVQQVFKLLQTHGQTDFKQVVTFVSCNGQLFARLRETNSTGFDELLGKWLDGLYLQRDLLDVKPLAISLVGSGCMDLQRMIDRFQRVLVGPESSPSLSVSVATRVVELLDMESDKEWASYQHRVSVTPISMACGSFLMAVKEYYRYCCDIQDYLDTRSCDLLRMLLEHLSRDEEQCSSAQVNIFLLRVMKQALVHDSSSITSLLMEKRTACKDLIWELLRDCIGLTEQAHPDVESNELFGAIFQAANPVNLEAGKLAVSMSYTGQAHQRQSIEQAAWQSIANNRLGWPELLSAVDVSISLKIKEFAAEQLLSIRPDPQTFKFDDKTTTAQLSNSLNVLSALSAVTDSSSSATTCVKLSQSLALVARRIAHHRAPERPLDVAVQHWIICLIRICLISQHALKAASNAPELHKILSFLSIVALAGAGMLAAPIRKLAYDVCAYFVAELPASAIASIRQHVGNPPAHTLASYLLGPRACDNAWLQLVTPATKPVTAVSSAYSTPQPAAPPPAQASVFQLRPFELLPDATPNAGVNDTALSLRLFGARQVPSRPM